MPAPHDIAGRRFGQLVAESTALDHAGRRLWACRCDCGAVVSERATRLIAGDVWACPACQGSRPGRPKVDRGCIVCGGTFSGAPNATLCSAECRRARRRGTDAGVVALPPKVDVCEVCGGEFQRDRGLRKTCSEGCLRERRKRRGRKAWRRRVARNPELTCNMARRRREKAAVDPEYAARLKQWEANKYAKHRERMRSDPEYATRIHQRAVAHYAAHAEEIQAKRKARLDAMTPEELGVWLRRARRYCREWRKKWRDDLVKNPIEHERFRSFYREYRRRLNAQSLSFQVARIQEILDGPRDSN
jgi:predicted nucleic acid-binding Zn ribbon protein